MQKSLGDSKTLSMSSSDIVAPGVLGWMRLLLHASAIAIQGIPPSEQGSNKHFCLQLAFRETHSCVDARCGIKGAAVF